MFIDISLKSMKNRFLDRDILMCLLTFSFDYSDFLVFINISLLTFLECLIRSIGSFFLGFLRSLGIPWTPFGDPVGPNVIQKESKETLEVVKEVQKEPNEVPKVVQGCCFHVFFVVLRGVGSPIRSQT